MELRPKGKIDMEEKKTFFELGDAAIGTIEARPEQMDRLDEATERVASGEFHVAIDPSLTIPAVCVDGRRPSPLAPNAAGGTLTVFVGDNLTTNRMGVQDGTTASGFANTLEVLQGQGHEVGAHTDTHAEHDEANGVEGDNCGCGACKKMRQIYQFIHENGDLLKDLATSLGVEVAGHDRIVQRAGEPQEFSTGKELYDTAKAVANRDYVPAVEDDHLEAILAINTVPNTTLDRNALERAYPGIQSFNTDVWSFEAAARATSPTEEEVPEKVTGMTYFNIATGCVLGGKKLRVVVIR